MVSTKLVKSKFPAKFYISDQFFTQHYKFQLKIKIHQLENLSWKSKELRIYSKGQIFLNGY